MLYTNQPDKTLHVTDYSDSKVVSGLIATAEKNIALFKSKLGNYNNVLHSQCIFLPLIKLA